MGILDFFKKHNVVVAPPVVKPIIPVATDPSVLPLVKNLKDTCYEGVKSTTIVDDNCEQDFDAFKAFEDGHREHQTKALLSLEGETKGQICLPTGTGKTRVQVSVHVKEMMRMSEQNKCGVFVISAHRLALCKQLLDDVVEIAVESEIPFDILYIGSDQFDETEMHKKFKHYGFNGHTHEAVCTTRQKVAQATVKKAHIRNRHIICVSTYHSFNCLNLLDRIDVCTYDEAHVLVGDARFQKNIETVEANIRKNFFFTATRRVQGEEDGMNSNEKFGDVLFEESPRKMIDAGEIIPPRFHIINTKEVGDFNNNTMLVNTVIYGYERHRNLVKENSCDSDSIGAKLLITTTGNKELNKLNDPDGYFRHYCTEKNIKVFSYSSKNGSFANFVEVGRNRALSEMKAMSDEDNAIILHIDILTEGIDLPAITGVMPFRELGTIKLLQTIGRAARLMKEDRRRLYSGEMLPMDWKHYVKPCCWVIFPELFESLENPEAMKNSIRAIIRAYEMPIEEYNAVDNCSSDTKPDVEKITKDDDNSNKKDRESELTHDLEELMFRNLKLEKLDKISDETLENFFTGNQNA